MQLGQISLCAGLGYNIKADEDKARILRDLDERFGVKVIRRHHERFDEAQHLPALQSHPHLMCLRTNGNPYYLYLTRYGFVDQCILIDKKVQQGYFYPRMILIRLWFADRLFEDTLFEGEMVRQADGSWTFLLNDLLALRGKPAALPVPSRPPPPSCSAAAVAAAAAPATTSSGCCLSLVQRVNKLHELIEHEFVPDDADLCRLRVKRYFPCDELRTMLCDFVPRLPYTCRGVYFCPLHNGGGGRAVNAVKLLNFDDSLVKRVVRTSFKDTSDFLLMSDVERLGTPHRQAPPSPPPPPSSPPVPPPPQQQQQQQQADEEGKRGGYGGGETTTMWVRHTRLPDVYELYRTPAEASRAISSSPACAAPSPAAMVACVPSIALSRALRDAFQNASLTEVIPMPCVFNGRFQKWQPVDAHVRRPPPPPPPESNGDKGGA